jgi:hypothetical protein
MNRTNHVNLDGQTTERQCVYCGGDFEPTHAKHCRPSCRKGAEDERRRAATAARRPFFDKGIFMTGNDGITRIALEKGGRHE